MSRLENSFWTTAGQAHPPRHHSRPMHVGQVVSFDRPPTPTTGAPSRFRIPVLANRGLFDRKPAPHGRHGPAACLDDSILTRVAGWTKILNPLSGERVAGRSGIRTFFRGRRFTHPPFRMDSNT